MVDYQLERLYIWMLKHDASVNSFKCNNHAYEIGLYTTGLLDITHPEYGTGVNGRTLIFLNTAEEFKR